MRHGENLTVLNVVSACLGLHLPCPVSLDMLSRANISIEPAKPPQSNIVYDMLLSVYWAWDYEDTYDHLVDEGNGHEALIKTPPSHTKPKSQKKTKR